jgi:hypothetical protein
MQKNYNIRQKWNLYAWVLHYSNYIFTVLIYCAYSGVWKKRENLRRTRLVRNFNSLSAPIRCWGHLSNWIVNNEHFLVILWSVQIIDGRHGAETMRNRFSQPVAQLVKKFRSFYGTRRFIAVFTRTRHWTLTGVKLIYSTLIPFL